MAELDYSKLGWEQLLSYFVSTVRAEHSFREMKISNPDQLMLIRSEIVEMAKEFIRRYEVND